MEHAHEDELGYKLKCRLAKFLADVGFSVIPPGTLGAGMGYRQSDNVTDQYDPQNDILTVTGTVTIEVYRAHKDHE
jgi:hypothetical protein